MAATGAAMIFLTPGCSSDSFLARFAPPGVVKYEDIASEKPPNPAIAETLSEYRETTRKRFPVLSRTPTAGAAPERPDVAARDALKTDLTENRDRLAEEIAGDEAAVAAERNGAGAIAEQGGAVNAQVARDAAAARAERREGLDPDPGETGGKP